MLNPVIIHFDEMLDRFYIDTNYKLYDPDVYNLLVEMQFRPSDVRAALNNIVALQDELRDPDAAEGYSRLSRRQKANYIAFLDCLIEGAHLYLHHLRKPRKKKIKTDEQLVATVAYQNEEKALRLISVAPRGIVGATEVWLFNTRYHALTRLVGEIGSLTVKGTTVLGFDPSLSKMKKIRKPEVLAEVAASTPAYILNFFDSLKTKEYAACGRINRQTIILKVIR